MSSGGAGIGGGAMAQAIQGAAGQITNIALPPPTNNPTMGSTATPNLTSKAPGEIAAMSQTQKLVSETNVSSNTAIHGGAASEALAQVTPLKTTLG